MTYPASATLKRDAIERLHRLLTAAKQRASSLSSAMAAGTVSATAVIDARDAALEVVAACNLALAQSWFETTARDETNQPLLNAAAELTAVRDAAQAVADQVAGDLPKNAQNFLIVVKLAAGGGLDWSSYTTAQTASLRADLDAFVATIG